MYSSEGGDAIMESILLEGTKMLEFCKELNIDSDVPKILIRINDNHAEYYNCNDKCFYEFDIEIAKKYL